MNTDTTPAVTLEIARFARSLDLSQIPADVQEIGRGHMLDAIGLMLAGSVTQGTRIVADYFRRTGCGGPARVIGTNLRLPTRVAAFVNGCAVHADDYDDTNPQHLPTRNGGIHASGAVLAATLSTADALGASGRAFAEAFHAGVEISCKINHAIDNRHYRDGFHVTGTINVFGACAAVGRLMQLDVDTLRTAFGIAGSQSAGLRENFGTMTKPFHAGHAADAGTFAAELAAMGFTAANNILEARRGFFMAAGGGFDPDVILQRMGNPWAFVDPGMWIKPYPCGALSHPAMTLLEEWIAEHHIVAEQVERIDVQTNERIHATLLHHRPRTGLQGKFSLEFALAAILIRGKAGFAEFTDEVVCDPAIQAMIERINYTTYAKLEPDYTNVTTFLTLTLKDGKKLSGRADFGKGHPRKRMDYEALAGKFYDCAERAKWPSSKGREVVDMVRNVERIADIRELSKLLVL